ncbi:unnamed protein product [Discosporangium mesarthrocarpum]
MSCPELHLQLLGTLMGMLFGLASGILWSSNDAWPPWVCAAPGVIFGSSVGVLGANSSEGQPQLWLLLWSLGMASVATILAGSLLSDFMEGGATEILMLAFIASMGSTTFFVARGHLMGISNTCNFSAPKNSSSSTLTKEV